MHTLPAQLTPLIGREKQVAEVRDLLLHPDVRLVTLSGVGGTGKTRLAIQVANTLIPDFEDGVYFVPLAAITDPTLVASAIGKTLDLAESGNQTFADVLKQHLGQKRLLLVLDNFEQVLDAATVVAGILAAALQVKVLITSRAALRLSGEHLYPVPPLTMLDADLRSNLTQASQYEALALFIARAQAIKPGFAVTASNVPAIAEICARLDGLPLAIELAAARVNVLSPEAILARLSNRLRLLTSGPRDAPARQQTLQNTLEWSYNLLTQPEQQLFTRLSVFAGGGALEAIEAICNPAGELGLDTLDGLASLVDKSLLWQQEMTPGEPRFHMLETIHEYAWDQLVANDGSEPFMRRHAAYFEDFAAPANKKLSQQEQGDWLKKLETEHDNLRAAIDRARALSDNPLAGRLTAALSNFWSMHGYLTEGRRRMDQALDADDLPTSLRAKLLNTASMLPANLTPREVEILKLVAQGLTDQQVADKLFLSRRTVSTHLVSIYGKLGVNSRAAAARWAVENGLA